MLSVRVSATIERGEHALRHAHVQPPQRDAHSG